MKAPVNVSSVGITDPVTVFDETMQFPWEVDDFRAKLRRATSCRRSKPGRRSISRCG